MGFNRGNRDKDGSYNGEGGWKAVRGKDRTPILCHRRGCGGSIPQFALDYIVAKGDNACCRTCKANGVVTLYPKAKAKVVKPKQRQEDKGSKSNEKLAKQVEQLQARINELENGKQRPVDTEGDERMAETEAEDNVARHDDRIKKLTARLKAFEVIADDEEYFEPLGGYESAIANIKKLLDEANEQKRNCKPLREQKASAENYHKLCRKRHEAAEAKKLELAKQREELDLQIRQHDEVVDKSKQELQQAGEKLSIIQQKFIASAGTAVDETAKIKEVPALKPAESTFLEKVLEWTAKQKCDDAYKEIGIKADEAPETIQVLLAKIGALKTAMAQDAVPPKPETVAACNLEDSWAIFSSINLDGDEEARKSKFEAAFRAKAKQHFAPY